MGALAASMPTCKEGQLEKALAVLTIGTLASVERWKGQVWLAYVLYMVARFVQR